jgi:branched-chain amino acid transport system ATP-binding protein
MAPLLRCEGVTKRFGGIVALDEFEASVDAGAITGLIGPNGAGKTTLFDVITGVLVPEDGAVVFDGEAITRRRPHEICQEGIGRSFQTPQPIRSLTVEENLRVAAAFGSPGDHDDARFERVLDVLGLEDGRDTAAGNLQMVEQKYVDLGRALMTRPKLVLLDETLAGLNPTEKESMITVIRRIHEEFDADFLVVEHDLGAIRDVSDTILVIDEGRFMMGGTPEDVLNDERVQEAYIGT